MATASTASAILAFFDSVADPPPVNCFTPTSQPPGFSSALLADLFDAPLSQSQCSAASPFDSFSTAVPFFDEPGVSPAASPPGNSGILTEALQPVQSPTVSSSSPSFIPCPFAVATNSSSPGSAQLDWPLPPSMAGFYPGFSSAQKNTCESDVSAQGESDHSDSEQRTSSQGPPVCPESPSKSRCRPRVEKSCRSGTNRGATSAIHIGSGTGISRTRARNAAPAELEVGMMFEGKYVTKAELRRIKNRESSARSYYNRKKRVEALELNLERTKELANTLLRKEMSLRQENALLKQRSTGGFSLSERGF